ncbi:Rhs family protein [Sorangium cellulosum So ce56]|uniref:Rhs family protein n=1 Tax=Sorangium cellulosum (strain So ce56) TaxID=448385 RepID=A9FZA9_SORC5|nr:SpvB/TcaC N-terminal domain-containing protein [Sorangium cellulosum]CAN98730.1 Rhs family protein [Sorangium cellulosum So ce56]
MNPRDPERDPQEKPGAAAAPRSSGALEARAGALEPVAPPAPSLPKGGGALRGIGEKFSVSATTGTGTVQVPIATSPARAGFHPELSLEYDSGAGNGPFGVGWRLSVPQITRKTERGLPRYEDVYESDVFVLSGAEDLVPALRESGSLQRFDDGDEVVERYRPRIEGEFARIERRRHRTTGAMYWRVTTRDNLTSIFGRSDGARIADPNAPQRVFSWLLEETRDDRGNVITYEYKAEDLAGVTRAEPHEAHRHAGLSAIANRYLKRIRYGNVAPGDASSMLFEVVFDYGEHDTAAPAVEEVNAWPCRQDAFSTYRAGFEIRTYRLCRRVLMFHKMAELGAAPCLMRSTDFAYDDSPVLTRLASVTHAGYLRDAETLAYTRSSYPPLDLGYSLPELHTEVKELDRASAADIAGALEGAHQWVDLDGEALPGLLVRRDEALLYKRNLGGGSLGPALPLPTRPSLSRGGLQVMDLDGDGQKEMVFLERPVAGYFDRAEGGTWAPFRPFAAQPVIDWSDPDLQLIDLNGDGHEDILLARGEVLVWYPSLAKGGFDKPITLQAPRDGEKGPALVFADRTQTVFRADMSGDGLTDLVRVRNGSVCYWPNLGYGRFGAKVEMARAPWFDHPDQFDPRRIRLADVDGSGTVDILYLHREGVRIYGNEAGNALAAPAQVPALVDAGQASSVVALDLLGTGTGCVVGWSLLPGAAGAPLRYIDLLGSKKPYLLTSVKNNLGRTTTVTYAPSTKFYLADRAAGRPWVTRLPFVVHVIERVEVFDAISRHRFVTTYAYHHGDYDGVERETRGFGMVEQRDTESFSAFSGAGFAPPAANADPELHLPPVLTKTWFHTGAWIEGAKISARYESEYYAGDAAAVRLADTQLPEGLRAMEVREACRALKGRPLRQEIYGLDGSAEEPRPYVVKEHSYAMRRLQPAVGNAHAVFLAHLREALEYHYERSESDPRVTHALTLEVDDYGAVLRAAQIGYRRRSAWAEFPEQGQGKATLTENMVKHLVPDEEGAYRIGVPTETRTYELHGLPLGSEGVLGFQAVFDAAAAAENVPTLAYDGTPSGGFQKRLLQHTRTRYWSDDLTGPLPFGEVGGRALVHESLAKVLTPSLITSVFGTRVTSSMLAEGGYLQLPDDPDYWVSSGRAVPSAAHFYLPTTFVDPFGNASQVAYDPYCLLVTAVTDPLSNVVEAVPDYRVLAPLKLTDANGNVSEVRFDALGRVTLLAVMGKPGAGEGDTPADPTATFAYDLERFRLTGKPSVVHARAREQHGAGNTRWLDTYSYSDGSGNEVLRKVKVEPGLAPERDANGALVHDAEGDLVFSHTTSRWVGTGRTVLDNKGNPVKQYEPFFSATNEYEDEAELVEWGVTPILRYDPLGRLIRTDLPNGTFSRVVFDAWKQTSHDPNDTVLESAWYAARQALPAGDPERRAANLAAAHAGTPAVSHLDALGRVFRAVADNGAEGPYVTQTTLDIEGQPLSITDARDNLAMQHRFGLGGQLLYQKSNDSGERWMLAGATGQRLRTWNARGFVYRSSYDGLRRPTHEHVQLGVGSERLARRYVYGEAHPHATAMNLRGRAYQVYDGAGVVTSLEYDFKGNLLQASRRLRSDVHADADWAVLTPLTDVSAIATAAEPLLETESFGTQTAYDALNRPTSLTAPDGLTASDASEVKPTYNEAGLLERVEARIRGAVAWTTFVDNIDYDAKGQRERIEYGNGTSTAYTYDPLTFRLSRLKTTRSSDSAVLQNLTYVYDPVGNIVEIGDSAQQTVFFNNAVVSPSAQYVYDAVYRLIEATGREHAGGLSDAPRDQNDLPIQSLPHANDAQALRNYTEQYVYDAVGNLRRMVHQAGTGSWTRWYAYEQTANNRLTSTTGDPANGPFRNYAHDAHGNMTSMPHITALTWDENDQVRSTDLDGGGDVYYDYDAAGQRVRKVWEHNGLVDERIYLGGYEVYRRRNSSGLVLERQTLHVMDGARRVAMVETKTVDTSGPFTVTPRARYQLDNHLGSASLEVDGAGLVIGYEEYHPFGTTAYWSAASGIEVSQRRYRYTGTEKDEETGLYYHGARYYAPWLGRWTSADPAGFVDGPNLYEYVRGNPIRLRDPSGRESTDQRIAQMTDVQLHRHVKALSPEARAEFTASATGKFQERVSVTLARGKLESIRTGVTTVEHVRPQPPAEPTHSIAPGRSDPLPGSVYVAPGGIDRSAADRLPDPVTRAVYKYLTEENPTAGKVVEALQIAGALVYLAHDLRSVKSAIITGSKSKPGSTKPEGSPAAASTMQKGAADAEKGHARGSGPAAGFFEVSDAYRSSKAVQKFGAATPMDFIFDAKKGRFIMSTERRVHGHDAILHAAGISPHPGIFGGRISRQAGGLVTDEWSGHYGEGWRQNPEIRQQFVDFMSKHGVQVTHTPWKATRTP